MQKLQIYKLFGNFKVLLIIENTYLYSSQHHPLMITASQSTLSLNNLKILRAKVTKNLMNLPKKFCESPSLCFGDPF
jgi:hypothetical protein